MEKNQVPNIIIDTNQAVLCTEIFQEAKRLTPTGKISHAKTRVYTQRYRKEWEQMPDFRGWLTSVPDQVTRAFCTYCKKNLHAHRLSLLKHTCTMKHQRAALMYQTQLQCKGEDDESKMIDFDEQFESVDVDAIKRGDDDDEEDENELEYVVERLDMEDEDTESRFEEVDPDYEEVDSVQLKFEINEDLPSNKKIKLDPSEQKDTLAQAMAHVHDEYLEDNNIENDLGLISEDLSTKESEHDDKKPILSSGTKSTGLDSQNIAPEQANNTVTITSVQNKTILLSTGKTVTLTTGKLPPGYVLSKVKGNLPSLVVAGPKSTHRPIAPKTTSTTTIPHTSSLITSSNYQNKPYKTNKIFSPKTTCISTHVLDTSKGLPIGGLQVSLYKLMDGRWTFLNESTTLPNGRCSDLVDTNKMQFTAGRYKLHFDVDKYFSLRRVETMFPFIEIVFDVKNPTGNHHIPILLTPFGYTTYRGIDRMEQPHISTHVLDTSEGVTVANLRVSLCKQVDDIWIAVSESKTNANGRCSDFLKIAGQSLSIGRYKLIFYVDEYFSLIQRSSIYPTIEVIFDIKNSAEHYHLPLLLNPYGFSTYRGAA